MGEIGLAKRSLISFLAMILVAAVTLGAGYRGPTASAAVPAAAGVEATLPGPESPAAFAAAALPDLPCQISGASAETSCQIDKNAGNPPAGAARGSPSRFARPPDTRSSGRAAELLSRPPRPLLL